MDYREGKEKLIAYMTDNGFVIELLPDRSNLKRYYQEVERINAYKKIAIRYPGYKSKNGRTDYCVYLVDAECEKPISYVEIMTDIYDKTTGNNYNTVKSYIENVAISGNRIDKNDYLNIDFNRGFDFSELTDLMFYIAIQEDINYPMPRYQGRKMCFKRYLEAMYTRINTNHTFDEAMQRAQTFGRPPEDWNDVGSLYENISAIR